MVFIKAMAVTITMVFAGSVLAKTSDKPIDTPQRLLERMDRNIDGKISFEEYRNAMVRRFDARDKNGDGVLEGKEYPKDWLAGADTMAANGKLTWDEFGEALQPVFDQYDADKDGLLDTNEIAAFAAARKAKEESK
ncbi:MAG TPA: EF-hand domain-containing protein [Arenimonas sp.]|nr:EF-hand domain-containing protein [Arenimonas sp.]HPW31356.1 EF-hand domain-containing protein [Arenimonas sp.]